MDKTAALASDILQGIGGEKNIQRLENCMTRVRVEVHDDDQLDHRKAAFSVFSAQHRCPPFAFLIYLFIVLSS